jgi:hypothetical protein
VIDHPERKIFVEENQGVNIIYVRGSML